MPHACLSKRKGEQPLPGKKVGWVPPCWCGHWLVRESSP